MKLISVSLDDGRSNFEVIGIVNVAKQAVKFQAVLNGVPYSEGDDYEEIREIMMEGVRINTENKESSN